MADEEDEPEKEPKQIQLTRRLVAMSAQRTYMNAERTLAVWVRTGLALMAFGLALDRFGLYVYRAKPGNADPAIDLISTWGGAALVAMGVLVALASGIRFIAYEIAYKQNGNGIPYHHGPFLASFFALMTGLFGLVLLILLIWYTPTLRL